MSESPIELDLRNGEWIGRGSYGEVYRFPVSHHPELKGYYVVKILRYDKRDQLESYKKECAVLAKLSHFHVVTYIRSEEISVNGQRMFSIVTEYCERHSLKGLIFDSKIIYSMKNLNVWAEQLFGALAYLYEDHQIIHRDIKSDNIFVTTDFTLKVGDFGSVKESEVTCSATYDVGTQRYMSPPQIDPRKPKEEQQGTRQASHRNDVYSLGLVLWEMIERRLVFLSYGYPEFHLAQFLWDIFTKELLHLEAPKCSGELQEIVKICVAFDRSLRPTARTAFRRIQNFNKLKNRQEKASPPLIEPTQTTLIRPIGFNDLETRVPVPDEEEDLIPPYGQSQHSIEGCSAKTITSRYKNLFDETIAKVFEEKFNLLHDIDQRDFINSKIPEIVAQTIHDTSYYVHDTEDQEDGAEVVNSLKNIKDIVEIFEVLLKRFHKRALTTIAYDLIYLSFRSVTLVPWERSGEIDELSESLVDRKSKLITTKFLFKAFLSTKTSEEWLLIRDKREELIFIRGDFHFKIYAEKWLDTEKTLCVRGDEELHFAYDQQIDIDVMLEKLKLVKAKFFAGNKIYLRKMVPLAESPIKSQNIQNREVGGQIPVEGYLFQLRNPPRTGCPHEPTCHSTFINLTKNVPIAHYSCASKEAVDYLSKWQKFCSFMENTINLGSSWTPFCMKKSGARAMRSNSFIFIQFRNLSEYFTLCDHPNNYEAHEQIPCLDAKFALCEMGATRIRRLLNEMTAEQQQYFVVAYNEEKDEWQHYLLNHQGQPIGWSDVLEVYLW